MKWEVKEHDSLGEPRARVYFNSSDELETFLSKALKNLKLDESLQVWRRDSGE